MNTFVVSLLIAMSAITMEKCTTRYLLVDIDDAEGGSKFCLLFSCTLKINQDNYH